MSDYLSLFKIEKNIKLTHETISDFLYQSMVEISQHDTNDTIKMFKPNRFTAKELKEYEFDSSDVGVFNSFVKSWSMPDTNYLTHDCLVCTETSFSNSLYKQLVSLLGYEGDSISVIYLTKEFLNNNISLIASFYNTFYNKEIISPNELFKCDMPLSYFQHFIFSKVSYYHNRFGRIYFDVPFITDFNMDGLTQPFFYKKNVNCFILRSFASSSRLLPKEHNQKFYTDLIQYKNDQEQFKDPESELQWFISYVEKEPQETFVLVDESILSSDLIAGDFTDFLSLSK